MSGREALSSLLNAERYISARVCNSLRLLSISRFLPFWVRTIFHFLSSSCAFKEIERLEKDALS